MKKTILVAVLLLSCSWVLAEKGHHDARANNPACRYVKHYDKHKHRYYYLKKCATESLSGRINRVLNTITPDKHSALGKRLQEVALVSKSRYAMSFYEPTYLLPGYYTESISPYYANNPGHTPDNQQIDHEEFKGQLSFLFSLWGDMFNSQVSLMASYTQLMYWQVYSKSPYFRETNYEPRFFLSYPFHRNWLASIGIDHQSNGRGGVLPNGMERSWNRVFVDIMFSGAHWLVVMEPWVPILKQWSSDLHNPDIVHYLGYGRLILAYKFDGGEELSLMSRNQLTSGFKRGALELDFAFPIHAKVQGYIQLFSGYGQSLIEYNHYTNAIGVGIALSNWI